MISLIILSCIILLVLFMNRIRFKNRTNNIMQNNIIKQECNGARLNDFTNNIILHNSISTLYESDPIQESH
jgi:hypothetical protein